MPTIVIEIPEELNAIARAMQTFAAEVDTLAPVAEGLDPSEASEGLMYGITGSFPMLVGGQSH